MNKTMNRWVIFNVILCALLFLMLVTICVGATADHFGYQTLENICWWSFIINIVLITITITVGVATEEGLSPLGRLIGSILVFMAMAMISYLCIILPNL